MMRSTHLLIIDPQNDFCDLPQDYLPFDPASNSRVSPALPVPGAHADMQRLAQFIDRAGAGISDISITLDSHHRLDIAHPGFWQTAEKQQVTPFTQISAAEVRSGVYQPRKSTDLARALSYLDALESAGRYQLMVWPVHCEIGSWGQNIHADVHAAYNRWEDASQRSVSKLSKGSNPWTEHYSAIMAEVPDAEDPATQLNRAFIDMLAQSDQILIAGEAGSHCVKATTEHIVDNFGPHSLSRLVLLTDCISPVSGFDSQYRDFLGDMQSKGLRLAQSTELLPELLARRAA
ncbi:cysteine hydrolase [Undibacterium terreum]|uniref:cysteine hydrolase n=1 Tax=Undibacterium terreum TaxID=1224302 RepID=UPI0016661A04|nr:cysteine hydrolase [Undibacterium terreum]